jgi:hypothetical protein
MSDDTADAGSRLAQSERARRTATRKAAAANNECELLRKEVRRLRTANFILQHNYDNSEGGGYRIRYEKLAEALQIIRQLASPEVTGIQKELPKTLEPWLRPDWLDR